MNGRSSTFGGVLGIFVIGCAVVFGGAYIIPPTIDFISGILWWSFGK